MCSGVVFFEQKAAYWMRISDGSSDVCSSDLRAFGISVNQWHTTRLISRCSIQCRSAFHFPARRLRRPGTFGHVMEFKMNPPLLRSPLLCLTLLALAACGGNGSEQGPAAPPQVGVIEVQPQDAVLSRERVGRLSPFRSADVRARVPGVQLNRSYEEGADVGKGQLLFPIDPADRKSVGWGQGVDGRL